MIESIAQIEHDGCTLRLQRAWPRSEDHLLVEYVDDDGRIVPGQWFADKSKLKSIYKQTQASCPDSGCTIVSVNDIELLLQPTGADRKLIGLQSLLENEDTTLISHRPERRAVVKLKRENGLRYAKVMKPGRIENAISVMNYINGLQNRSFDVPKVIESNKENGVVVFSQLPGISLYDSIQESEDLKIIEAIGNALHNLHEAVPSKKLPIHDNEAEITVLKKWIKYAKSFNCEFADDINSSAKSVYIALRNNPSEHCLLHRDFYNKQIIVGQYKKIGFLDFDTIAMGEAALDLANVLIHLNLRSLQGMCSSKFAANSTSELLSGYGVTAELIRRIAAYKNAASLRLACVYSFRPDTQHICEQLSQTVPFS